MADRQISKERVEAIIAAYGADPARWPEAEREGVLKFIESYSGREVFLQSASGLDVLLESAEQPTPSNMLKARLLEDASLAIVSSRNEARVKNQAHSWSLAGVIDRIAGILSAPASLKPVAVSAMMVPVLVLGIWVGASLNSEALDEEELFAEFGEDYELWTENDLLESIDPLSEVNGETG